MIRFVYFRTTYSDVKHGTVRIANDLLHDTQKCKTNDVPSLPYEVQSLRLRLQQ